MLLTVKKKCCSTQPMEEKNTTTTNIPQTASERILTFSLLTSGSDLSREARAELRVTGTGACARHRRPTPSCNQKQLAESTSATSFLHGKGPPRLKKKKKKKEFVLRGNLGLGLFAFRSRSFFLGHVCILNYISPLHYVMWAEHFSCLPWPAYKHRQSRAGCLPQRTGGGSGDLASAWTGYGRC